MKWRERVQRVGLDNQPHVLPIVEIHGAVSPYSVCPHVGAGNGLFLVLTIPIVYAVLHHNLRRVGMYGIPVGVKPLPPGLDAVVALGLAGND